MAIQFLLQDSPNVFFYKGEAETFPTGQDVLLGDVYKVNGELQVLLPDGPVPLADLSNYLTATEIDDKINQLYKYSMFPVATTFNPTATLQTTDLLMVFKGKVDEVFTYVFNIEQGTDFNPFGTLNFDSDHNVTTYVWEDVPKEAWLNDRVALGFFAKEYANTDTLNIEDLLYAFPLSKNVDMTDIEYLFNKSLEKEVTYTTETTLYQAEATIPHVQADSVDLPLAPLQEVVLHAQNDQGYWSKLQQLEALINNNQAMIMEQNKKIFELQTKVAALEEAPPPEPAPEYNMEDPLVLKTPPLIGLLGIEIGGINVIGNGYTVESDGLVVIDGASTIGLLTPTWIAVNGEKADPASELIVLTIIGGGNTGQFTVKTGDIITESGMGTVTFYPEKV